MTARAIALCMFVASCGGAAATVAPVEQPVADVVEDDAASIAMGGSCEEDPEPTTVAEGEVGAQLGDVGDGENLTLRVAVRDGDTAHAVVCTRGSVAGERNGRTVSTTRGTIGETDVIVATETIHWSATCGEATEENEGRCSGVVALAWVLGSDLRMIGQAEAEGSTSPARIEDGVLHLGERAYTIANGELVSR